MLMDFDGYMQKMINMHQHLEAILFHSVNKVYVQRRKFCMINYYRYAVGYYYRCAVGQEEEEDLPSIEELITR